MMSTGVVFLGSGRTTATFVNVAPAEGEFVSVSASVMDLFDLVPIDFVQFEVRSVGGQLFYGAHDETGASTGFTNTLAFSESLVLELTWIDAGSPEVQLRYATDGGAFVDVTAELAGLDPIDPSGTWTEVFATLEAGLLPAPPLGALLATAALALAALRRRRP
jgi:hypothetical protein